MRIIFFALSLTALILADATHSPASSNDDIMAKKVNIAGRQRMLTQRIAKAACYISLFSEVDEHVVMLKHATNLFDKSLSALKNGDKDMGIPAEKNPAILRELSQLEEEWRILEFSSRLLIDLPNYPGADVDLIADHNIPTLELSHMTVELMNSIYGKSSVKNNGLITAINVAGRQRMLTQKAAKEFCLISYGKNTDIHRAALKKTISQFDQALLDLQKGNKDLNIPPAPTFEIEKQLIQIRGNWQKAREVMLEAANGKTSHTSDFRIISFANETLLKQSNDVVKMFVTYNKAANAS